MSKIKLLLICLSLILFFLIFYIHVDNTAQLELNKNELIFRQKLLGKHSQLIENNLRDKNLPIIFEKLDNSPDIISSEVGNKKDKFIRQISNFFLTSKKEKKIVNFKKKIQFSKYRTEDILTSITGSYGGTFYMESTDENLFLLTVTGIFAYTNLKEIKENKINFIQLPSNIEIFKTKSNLYNKRGDSFRDIFIYKEKIYVSYIREVNKNCFNTSILVADINLKKLNFKNFFSPGVCVNIDNEDKDFNMYQSGGRITYYKNNKILFSIGDYRYRKHAQDLNSIFGKIISIDIDTRDYKIISLGHRNPQGLTYDKKNDIIYMSEHGPKGGDEININKNPNQKIRNYGWAISSYGEHYEKKRNEEKYKKYPLHKSHEKYGFIEPLIYYKKSIGFSEMLIPKPGFFSNEKNQILVSSLRRKSLYFYELNGEHKIKSENIVYIGDRIRDIIYVKKLDTFILSMEDTTSIGILSKIN